MAYQIEVSNYNGGEPITKLGRFGNVASARQAILDHSNTIDLPPRGPDYHLPEMLIVEGWIIGNTEYAIYQAA